MAATGVDMDALRPLPLCLDRGGVGVASEEANRDRLVGGVANADGVEDRRRLLRRPPSPGDDSVLPIGLEKESSGEEGPAQFDQIRKRTNRKPRKNVEGEILTVVEIRRRRRIGGHGC